MTDEPVLSVEGLARRFGGRDVVAGLDLELRAGERVALCGANGAGKTTVLRCIAGTVSPTNGRITVLDYPAGSLEARRWTGVSLSQDRSFYLRLSGRNNLLFFAGVRGMRRGDADRMVDALEQELELGDILAKRVDRCSTGMVQQLAFARALLGVPRILLLDEPTRSLDTEATARLWRAIEARPHLAVIIATHRDDDVARCQRRIDLP
ncbi:ABC transporter ATP-binding protein [Gaiella sp.]|uniref:ABC transporter ATP-binding protein n=1 Tax=Gaiella sp. TaxID=2663207 RepID=UPI002E340218|nr:ABC transporter ATP-binding protein [Gaiella sp.]HEX5583430.1 ABC transporter ATP-binding protein [Gaiella sp.]